MFLTSVLYLQLSNACHCSHSFSPATIFWQLSPVRILCWLPLVNYVFFSVSICFKFFFRFDGYLTLTSDENLLFYNFTLLLCLHFKIDGMNGKMEASHWDASVKRIILTMYVKLFFFTPFFIFHFPFFVYMLLSFSSLLLIF